MSPFTRADDADLERRRFRSERAHFQALTEDSAEDSRRPGTFATFTCGNAVRKKLKGLAVSHHASRSLTTPPATLVRRRSRPWNLTVSRLWSMPSKRRIVACRSCTWTTCSTAL